MLRSAILAAWHAIAIPIEAPLQVRLDRLVRDSLRPACAFLVVMYVVVTLGHYAVQPPAASRILIPLAATSAVLIFALFIRLGHRPLDPRWSQPLGGVLVLLLIANALLTFTVAGEPHQTTNFSLLAFGIGCFFLSARWFAAALGATLAAWLAGMLLLPPSSLHTHYAFYMAGSALLATLTHTIRLGAFARLERLRQQDEERRERLESALEQREVQLRDVTSQIPGVVFQIVTRRDGTFRFPFVSEGTSLDGLGLSAEGIRRDPETAFSRILPQDRDAVMSTVIDTGPAPRSMSLEYRIRTRSGELRWVNASVVNRLLPDGDVLSNGVLLDVTELRRAEAARNEEAEISAALLRVAREMISSLDSAALLDRLCHLTTEVLGCDSSHTVLWEPRISAYVPLAGHGDTAEQREAMRLLTLEPAVFDELPRNADAVAQFVIHEEPGRPLAAIARHFGITVLLLTPLGIAGERTGFQLACYRGRRERFTRQQERIAEGIGKLASIALSNARMFERLQIAERLKSEFVATMSHELRTPIQIILGYVDLLQDGMLGSLSAEQDDAVDKIRQAAESLFGMMGAVLDFSRLEAEQEPMRVEAVSVREMLAEVIAAARKSAPHIEVKWTVDPSLSSVRTDPLKLKLIFRNLIDNAIKFTEAGDVTVDVRKQDGGFELEVMDTGIGITPEVLPIMFEPFRQGDSSATRRFGGIGLGLYLVRREVEALRGKLELQTQVGRGSTFRVWLPTHPPTPAGGA